MQIVLNGKACYPTGLGDDLVWSVVERLETFGWRRVSTVGRVICLEK